MNWYHSDYSCLPLEAPKSLLFISPPGELSMEELLQQYAGAYASDASAPGSGSSEEEEEDEVEANSSDCEPEGATEAEEAPQEDSSSQSGKCVVMRQDLGRAGIGGTGMFSTKPWSCALDSADEHSENEEDEPSEEEETSRSSESEDSESDESEESRSQSQANEEDEEEDDFGVEYLLARDEEQSEVDAGSGPPTPGPTTTLGPKKEITDIAAAAESLQPKGYTLATTQVSLGPSFCFLLSWFSCFLVTDALVPPWYLSSFILGQDTHSPAFTGPAPGVPAHWVGLAGYYVWKEA